MKKDDEEPMKKDALTAERDVPYPVLGKVGNKEPDAYAKFAAPGAFLQHATAGRDVQYQVHYTPPVVTQLVPLEWETKPAFGGRCRAVVVADMYVDLLLGALVRVTLRGSARRTRFPVERLLGEARLVIDGRVVETVTSQWARLYGVLHRDAKSAAEYDAAANFDGDDPQTKTFLVPLIFTFCRKRLAALPLLAMHRAPVRLEFILAAAEDIGLDPGVLDMTICAEYGVANERFCNQMWSVPVEQVVMRKCVLPRAEARRETLRVDWTMLGPLTDMYFAIETGGDSVHSAQLRLEYEDGPKVDRTPEMPFSYYNEHLVHDRYPGRPIPGLGVISFVDDTNPRHHIGFERLSLYLTLDRRTDADEDVVLLLVTRRAKRFAGEGRFGGHP